MTRDTTTADEDRDQLLRAARKHVVDQHGGDILTSLRDPWARFGWLVTLGHERAVLVAKYETHDGRVSFSKPAIAEALRREVYLALWNDTAECIRVFDPEWVRAEGQERYVESKHAEIGVKDVSPTGGVPDAEFVRGERPPGVGGPTPTTLTGVET